MRKQEMQNLQPLSKYQLTELVRKGKALWKYKQQKCKCKQLRRLWANEGVCITKCTKHATIFQVSIEWFGSEKGTTIYAKANTFHFVSLMALAHAMISYVRKFHVWQSSWQTNMVCDRITKTTVLSRCRVSVVFVHNNSDNKNGDAVYKLWWWRHSHRQQQLLNSHDPFDCVYHLNAFFRTQHVRAACQWMKRSYKSLRYFTQSKKFFQLIIHIYFANHVASVQPI